MLTIRDARTNNLRGLDLDIDPRAITAVCGVSGSGKTSLVFDTIHAESQRRYLETFSPRVREQLARLPRADCERIDRLPPTIAIPQDAGPVAATQTVGDESDLADGLAIAFAACAEIFCPECGHLLTASTPASLAHRINAAPAGHRYLIGFAVAGTAAEAFPLLEAARLSRAVVGRTVRRLDGGVPGDDEGPVFGVVDRVVAGKTTTERLVESIGLAMAAGRGRCVLFSADGDEWTATRESQRLTCPDGHVELDRPTAADFRGRTSQSVCSDCRGDGCDRCGESGLATWVRTAVWSDETWAEWQTRPLVDWPADRFEAELRERLAYLTEVGLGGLSVDRSLRSLSSGQLQRLRLVRLATTGLVGSLIILDEPTAGLSELEVTPVETLIRRLHTAGNGVVLIEHRLPMLAIAHRVLELGPGPGSRGGELIYDGPPDDHAAADTPTGRAFHDQPPMITPKPAERVSVVSPVSLGAAPQAFELPIDRLTVLEGRSGAGKTRLLHSLAIAFGRPVPVAASEEPDEATVGDGAETDVRHDAQPQDIRFRSLLGEPGVQGESPIEDVVIVDQSPASLTMRSSVATASKALDDIRAVLAGVPEAKARGLTARHFSYNAPGGGRCQRCRGRGTVTVAMAHLADLPMSCPRCHGRRYEADVLTVKYRRRSIADVLAMTVEESLAFFRSEVTIHKRLQPLKDVGLGYLTLGRALPTLSGGESQRLKLASHLLATTRGRVLFLFDEPARGLHPADAVTLAASLRRLLEIGHTVVAADHSPAIRAVADYICTLSSGTIESNDLRE